MESVRLCLLEPSILVLPYCLIILKIIKIIFKNMQYNFNVHVYYYILNTQQINLLKFRTALPNRNIVKPIQQECNIYTSHTYIALVYKTWNIHVSVYCTTTMRPVMDWKWQRTQELGYASNCELKLVMFPFKKLHVLV